MPLKRWTCNKQKRRTMYAFCLLYLIILITGIVLGYSIFLTFVFGFILSAVLVGVFNGLFRSNPIPTHKGE